MKLPGWFEIDTPVGKYNPDWAIVKHDGQALYPVRETKGTKDFLKLRSSEADKVRFGQKHFELFGVPFAPVVSADEIQAKWPQTPSFNAWNSSLIAISSSAYSMT